MAITYQRPWRIDDAMPPAERERRLNAMALDASRRSYAVARAAQQLGGRLRLHDGVVYLFDPRVEQLNRAMRYVQDVGYVPDPPDQEWWQPVDYTLAHGGDCEDLAEAFVAVALRLGYRARVKWLSQDGFRYNHVYAQVWLGDRAEPYPAELTLRGARFGEAPRDAADRLRGWENIGVQH